MITVASSTRSVTQSIYFFLYMATIFGASPRVSIGIVSKPRQHLQKIYTNHWTKSRDQVSGDYQPAHSDAMQLYSIGAGQLVMVQNLAKQSWDTEYELSAIRKKGKSGKQNKFVTETISYGRLKIRSEENKMYICAKSNGNIIFKSSADNSKKRPRKRCLFMWSFTKEKHIQLSINSGGTKWFLAVKDGIVKLLPQNLSSAKERSFIWLPTRSANSRPMKSSRKRYDIPARGFSLMRQNDCDYFERQVNRQKNKITELSDQNKQLENEVAKLKKLISGSINTVTSSDDR